MGAGRQSRADSTFVASAEGVAVCVYVCVCKCHLYLSSVTTSKKHSVWDLPASRARGSTCFLMNPQLEGKEGEGHSYYPRQLQAARCLSLGNGKVHASEEAVVRELWPRLLVKLVLEVLWDRETSQSEAAFSS